MAGFLDSLLAPFSTGPAEKASQDQIDALRQAYAAYAGQAQQGRTDLTSNYTAGLAPTLQNVQTGQAGQNQLLRALGIQVPGEAPGTGQDIQSLLASTPGYQFQLNQGLDSVLRKGAQAGSLASGGTNTDLTNYAQGLAGTTYNNYVQQLQPFLNYSTQNAGNALQGYGNLGSGLAGIDIGQGNAAYGMNVGVGNAQANADLAPYTAGKNIWGALGGALSLGSNLLGGGGGGALTSGLTGLFGGGSGGGNTGAGSNKVASSNSLFGNFSTPQWSFPSSNVG